MNPMRPVCVLVAALGGQGGGVLADWLAAAADIDGLAGQATSIPGVAQRTGATTYYFEVYPRHDPAEPAVFSIYPASGAVDLVVSFEPMEAARALADGFIGGETTVITACRRIYATAEKIRPGDGRSRLAPVLDGLRASAGRLRVIDMGAAARAANCHPNAVMFGAMAASGVLPMAQASCRRAIEDCGVAVKASLAGFEAGLDLADAPAGELREAAAGLQPPPAAFAGAIAGLPEPVRGMAGHAAGHLLDYQDGSYVAAYLDRLARVVAVDDAARDHRLSLIVARRLAAWMAFDDVIRVAQAKTRPGRLARIRRELGVGHDVPLSVHDYLKPGREEIAGLLPARLAGRLAAGGRRRYGAGLAVKLKTSAPAGWLVLRALAGLRRWRPRTARFEREQAMIERWLAAVVAAAGEEYELACMTAELAVWARGYGDVRRRGMERLSAVLAGWRERLAADRADLRQAVEACLAAAYSDPDREVAQ